MGSGSGALGLAELIPRAKMSYPQALSVARVTCRYACLMRFLTKWLASLITVMLRQLRQIVHFRGDLGTFLISESQAWRRVNYFPGFFSIANANVE